MEALITSPMLGQLSTSTLIPAVAIPSLKASMIGTRCTPALIRATASSMRPRRLLSSTTFGQSSFHRPERPSVFRQVFRAAHFKTTKGDHKCTCPCEATSPAATTNSTTQDKQNSKSDEKDDWSNTFMFQLACFGFGYFVLGRYFVYYPVSPGLQRREEEQKKRVDGKVAEVLGDWEVQRARIEKEFILMSTSKQLQIREDWGIPDGKGYLSGSGIFKFLEEKVEEARWKAMGIKVDSGKSFLDWLPGR